MNDFYLRMRATLWWLLPLAAVAALIALETDFGSGLRRHAAAGEPVVPKPVAVSLLPEYTIDGGVAKHTETVSRPLFVPTRRPAPVPVVEVAKPVMKKGQFALTGTTVAGERSLAFLKEVSGGKSRTVKMGDTINGLLVAEVKPDRVRLSQGDETEELVLRVAANPRTTPQPAAPPPGAPPGMQPPGQAPAQPPVAAGQAGGQDAGQSLAERRRAARAAAQAAANAQAETGAVPPSAPIAPPPNPAAPPQQSSAPGTVAQPDSSWSGIYQRYQQRRN